MRNKLYAIVFLNLLTTISFAQVLRLEGKVDSQYPIVIELTREEDGVYSGRYAYKSTLRNNGDIPSSYLYIQADVNDPYGNWIVRDNEGAVKEHWFSINFAGQQNLMARVKNNASICFDIEASVNGISASDFPLISYYRHHLGDYVNNFDMFNDVHVSDRLQKMMGYLNFCEMKDIYKAENPIEYHNGLYWAPGFEEFNCFDPMTVWAYDTRTNKFYVWVRKNGKDFWWGEDGKVVFEFRELVELNY